MGRLTSRPTFDVSQYREGDFLKKGTACISAFMLLLSFWVIWMSFQLKDSMISYDVGPAVYPRLICGIIIFLSLLLLVVDCFLKKENQELVFLTRKNLFHILLISAFMLLLKPVGFPICAFLIIAVMMKTMGCPKLWQIIVFSAIVSIGLYLIFRSLLNVRLPLGLLEGLF